MKSRADGDFRLLLMPIVNMAESNSKSGILALAQKRLSRTKTKVLQNLGKAEKTTDDVFNENVLKVEKQQEIAHHLQKELKTYAHCLREMNQATLSLTTALSEIYEPEWTKESTFKNQLQVFELLWNDFLQSVQDSVVAPLNNYLQSFPVLKAKVAKRGRKMVDYDNCRHHLEVLLSARKKDELKIHKAQEEMKEAKRIYEELNSELRSELPDFYNSRVTFYAGLLSSLFGAGHVFHSETGKVYLTLDDICQELSKDFEQFIYKPKQTLSKSISSNSGENGFSDDISVHGSPSVQLARSSLGSRCSSPGRDTSQSVYSNQEVPEIKQHCYQLKRKAPVAPPRETSSDKVQEVSSNCVPARKISSETSSYLSGRAAVAEFSYKYFCQWKNKFTHKSKKASVNKHVTVAEPLRDSVVSVKDSSHSQHAHVDRTKALHSASDSYTGLKNVSPDGELNSFCSQVLTNTVPVDENDRQGNKIIVRSSLQYQHQKHQDISQISEDYPSHKIDSLKDVGRGLPFAGPFDKGKQKARGFIEGQAADVGNEASDLSLVGSLKDAGKEMSSTGQFSTSKQVGKVFPEGQPVGEAADFDNKASGPSSVGLLKQSGKGLPSTGQFDASKQDTKASSLSAVGHGDEAERVKECVKIVLKPISITQSVSSDGPDQEDTKEQPPFDLQVRRKPQGIVSFHHLDMKVTSTDSNRQQMSEMCIPLKEQQLCPDFTVQNEDGRINVVMLNVDKDIILLTPPVEQHVDKDIILLTPPVEQHVDKDIILLTPAVEQHVDKDIILLTPPIEQHVDKDIILLTPPFEQHVDPHDTHPVDLLAPISDSTAPGGSGIPPVYECAPPSQGSNILQLDDDSNRKMSPTNLQNSEGEKVPVSEMYIVGEIAKLGMSSLKASELTTDGSRETPLEHGPFQMEMMAVASDLDLSQSERFLDVEENMEREPTSVRWDDTVRMWVDVDGDTYYFDKEPLLGDLSDEDNDAEFYTVGDASDVAKVEKTESIKDVETDTTSVQKLLTADTSKYYTMTYTDISSVDQSDDDQCTESSREHPVQYHELESQSGSAEKAQTSTEVKIFDNEKVKILTQHLLKKHHILVPPDETAPSPERTSAEAMTSNEMITSPDITTSAEELSSSQASSSADDSSAEMMDKARHRKDNIAASLANNRLKLLNEHLMKECSPCSPRSLLTDEEPADDPIEAVCANTEDTPEKNHERSLQKSEDSDINSLVNLDKRQEEVCHNHTATKADLLLQSTERFDAVICSLDICGLPKTEVGSRKSRSLEDTFTDHMPDVWKDDNMMEECQTVAVFADNMQDVAGQEVRCSSSETCLNEAERKRTHTTSIFNRHSNTFSEHKGGNKSQDCATWKQQGLSRQQRLFTELSGPVMIKPGTDSSSSGCLLHKKNKVSFFGPSKTSVCKSLSPLLPSSRWSLDCVRFIKNTDRNVSRDETEDEPNLSDSTVSLEIKIDHQLDPEIGGMEKAVGKARPSVCDGSSWSFKGFMSMLLPQTVQMLASHTKSYINSCVHSRPSDRHLQEIHKIVMESLSTEDYQNLFKKSEGSSVDITVQQDSPSPHSGAVSPLSQTKDVDELKLGHLDTPSPDRDVFYTPDHSLATPNTPEATDIKYVDSSSPVMGAMPKDPEHTPAKSPHNHRLSLEDRQNRHDHDVAILEKHFQTVLRDIVTKGSSKLRKVSEGAQSPPSFSRSHKCEGGGVRSVTCGDVVSSEGCEQEGNMSLHDAMLSRLQMSVPILATSQSRSETRQVSEDMSVEHLCSWAASRESVHIDKLVSDEATDDSFKSCQDAVQGSEMKHKSATNSDGLSRYKASEKSPGFPQDHPPLNLTASLAQRRIALETVQDEDEWQNSYSQDESDLCSHSCQSSSESAGTSGSPVLGDPSREAAGCYDYLTFISGSGQSCLKIPIQRRFEPSLSFTESLLPTLDDHSRSAIRSQSQSQRQIRYLDPVTDSLWQNLNPSVILCSEAACDIWTLDTIQDHSSSEESPWKPGSVGSVLDYRDDPDPGNEHVGPVERCSRDTVRVLVDSGTVRDEQLASCDAYKETCPRNSDLISFESVAIESAAKMPLMSRFYSDIKHKRYLEVDSESLPSSNTTDLQSEKLETDIQYMESSSNNRNIKEASGLKCRDHILQHTTGEEAVRGCKCQDKKLRSALKFLRVSEYFKSVLEQKQLPGSCGWDWAFSSGQLVSCQKCQLPETMVGLSWDDDVCKSMTCENVESCSKTHGQNSVCDSGCKEARDIIQGVDFCGSGGNLNLLNQDNSLVYEQSCSSHGSGIPRCNVLLDTQLADGQELAEEHFGRHGKCRCDCFLGFHENLGSTDVPVDSVREPVDDTNVPVDNTPVPVNDMNVPVDITHVPVNDMNVPVDNTHVQRTSIPSSQHNGSNPLPAERADKRLSNISAQDRGSKVDDRRHSEEDNNNSSISNEHKDMHHNVYNEPHETPSNLAASIGRVSIRHEFSESDSDDDDDDEPVYSNPASKHPLASPPPNTLYAVQAVHKYTNEDEDELSFEPGEIIYVVEFDNPEEQDEGWQMGVRASDGVRGVFPENFTIVLSSQAR